MSTEPYCHFRFNPVSSPCTPRKAGNARTDVAMDSTCRSGGGGERGEGEEDHESVDALLGLRDGRQVRRDAGDDARHAAGHAPAEAGQHDGPYPDVGVADCKWALRYLSHQGDITRAGGGGGIFNALTRGAPRENKVETHIMDRRRYWF